MDEAAFFIIKEGIELLKRHEYNKATEKLTQGMAQLRKVETEARRMKIDEINHTLVLITCNCKELELQLEKVKSINHRAELSAVTDLLKLFKQIIVQLKAEKRAFTRISFNS